MPDCVGKNYSTPRRFSQCVKNAIIIVNIVAMVVIVIAEKYRVVCRDRDDFHMKDSEETERLI